MIMVEKVKLAYIAGPYRGKTKEECDLNVQSAKQIAKLVANKGWMPVTPHLNTHGFEFLCPHLPDQFWLDGTLELMRKCDIVVLCPGWEFSSGTKAEILEAARSCIPVYYELKDIPRGLKTYVR